MDEDLFVDKVLDSEQHNFDITTDDHLSINKMGSERFMDLSQRGQPYFFQDYFLSEQQSQLEMPPSPMSRSPVFHVQKSILKKNDNDQKKQISKRSSKNYRANQKLRQQEILQENKDYKLKIAELEQKLEKCTCQNMPETLSQLNNLSLQFDSSTVCSSKGSSDGQQVIRIKNRKLAGLSFSIMCMVAIFCVLKVQDNLNANRILSLQQDYQQQAQKKTMIHKYNQCKTESKHRIEQLEKQNEIQELKHQQAQMHLETLLHEYQKNQTDCQQQLALKDNLISIPNRHFPYYSLYYPPSHYLINTTNTTDYTSKNNTDTLPQSIPPQQKVPVQVQTKRVTKKKSSIPRRNKKNKKANNLTSVKKQNFEKIIIQNYLQDLEISLKKKKSIKNSKSSTISEQHDQINKFFKKNLDQKLQEERFLLDFLKHTNLTSDTSPNEQHNMTQQNEIIQIQQINVDSLNKLQAFLNRNNFSQGPKKIMTSPKQENNKEEEEDVTINYWPEDVQFTLEKVVPNRTECHRHRNSTESVNATDNFSVLPPLEVSLSVKDLRVLRNSNETNCTALLHHLEKTLQRQRLLPQVPYNLMVNKTQLRTIISQTGESELVSISFS